MKAKLVLKEIDSKTCDTCNGFYKRYLQALDYFDSLDREPTQTEIKKLQAIIRNLDKCYFEGWREKMYYKEEENNESN